VAAALLPCNIIQSDMDQAKLVCSWRSVLFENGFDGSAERAESLAKFLVRNEFTRPAQLKLADHPSEWLGAEDVGADDLEIVWALRWVRAVAAPQRPAVQRQRSR
jgi:hypothetical protein